MRLKRLASLTIGLLCLMGAVFNASAEEIVAGHPMRWNITINGKYTVRCSDSSISAYHPCYGYIITGVNKFHATSPSSVAATNVSSSAVASVNYQVASDSFWDTYVNSGYVTGYTVNMDNKGKHYYGYSDYQAPLILLQGSRIFFNPNTDAYRDLSYNDYIQLVMHELGHSFGMGHNIEVPYNESIMTEGGLFGLTALTARDVSVLKGFYG